MLDRIPCAPGEPVGHLLGIRGWVGRTWAATKGGPSYATWFFALHIYQQAFEYFRMGYGSALAWLFAIILLVFTYIQMRTSDRWVYYAGEK